MIGRDVIRPRSEPLRDRVAVVTGASSGIGEATVRALSAEGMHVVAVARRWERLERLADTIPRVVALQGDVTVADDVRNVATTVRQTFGHCHLLLNNAGINKPQPLFGEDDVQHVEHAMEVNFMGAVRCMAAFASLLFSSAPSTVINVGSVAGKIGVGAPAYTASKFALVGLTEAAGMEWRDRGVRVCQLNPGFILTEGFPQDELVTRPGIRRLLRDPDDVARAVVQLARRPRAEQTVPRWYRPVVVARHVWGGGFRAASRRLIPS